MKHTGSSICSYIDGLTMYLRERGCEFNKIGFPLLEPTWFMTDSPTCMTTFRDRKASFVTDPPTPSCVSTATTDVSTRGSTNSVKKSISTNRSWAWSAPI